MALVRTRDGNDLQRPETSKLSRSSKRSRFTMTATNFNVNNHDHKRGEKGFDKKNETQANFGNIEFSNNRRFSPSFQIPNHKFGLNQNQFHKAQTITQENLPNIYSTESKGIMSSSLGFQINSTLPQKGMTLDKLLGGGFKKISVFDVDLEEFAEKDSARKSNRVPTPENKEESKNFDIVETEEEEDGNLDVYQSTPYKSRDKEAEYDDRIINDENGLTTDKIQKKYKTRKVKSIFKKRQPQVAKGDPSLETFETEENDSDRRNQEVVYPEGRGRERDSVISKAESKSLSPKLATELKKNRFQSLVAEKQKIAMNSTKNSFLNGPLAGPKKSPYDIPIDSKSQTQNKFRISTNKFRSTKENLRNESESANKTNYQKPLQVKALLSDVNYPRGMSRERRPEQEVNRVSSRITNVIPDKIILHNEEPAAQPNVEKKFTRQTKFVAEKIVKTEQDIMQKYSKMFSFNDERTGVPKNGYKMDEGIRRLSTPLRDFDSAKFLQKKVINP